MFSVKMKKEKNKDLPFLSDADEANFVAGNIWETRTATENTVILPFYTEPTLRPELLKMR
jgi:hypothetical protein